MARVAGSTAPIETEPLIPRPRKPGTKRCTQNLMREPDILKPKSQTQTPKPKIPREREKTHTKGENTKACFQKAV